MIYWSSKQLNNKSKKNLTKFLVRFLFFPRPILLNLGAFWLYAVDFLDFLLSEIDRKGPTKRMPVSEYWILSEHDDACPTAGQFPER